MASIVSAGTTSSTALVATADTTGALQLATNNGTVAVTVDTSQNVGIGTSSPSVKLNITDATSSVVRANQTTNGTDVRMVANASGAFVGSYAGTSLYLVANSATAATIDTNGNFLVNNGAVYFTSAQYRSNVTSSQLQFINNAAGVSLAVNGTSWGSLSDERDKEIIEPIADAASKVASLRSVIGRYKVDEADKRRAFLIAQDVKAVLPEAVTELEDEQKTLILQYTEVIPLLVAAINELTAKVTALEAKVGASA